MNNYFTETSKANMSLLSAVSFHEIELQVYLERQGNKEHDGNYYFFRFSRRQKKKTNSELSSLLPPAYRPPKHTNLHTNMHL